MSWDLSLNLKSQLFVMKFYSKLASWPNVFSYLFVQHNFSQVKFGWLNISKLLQQKICSNNTRRPTASQNHHTKSHFEALSAAVSLSDLSRAMGPSFMVRIVMIAASEQALQLQVQEL